MKKAGTVLLFIGVAALVYGGYIYNQDRTILEIGSLQITADSHRDIPVPAIIGAIILVAAISLLAIGTRSASRS